MDNYNGQNQFETNQMNQNQYGQPQYGQFQQVPQQIYQQAPQNMEMNVSQNMQQPQFYQNGYNMQPNMTQTKKKKKWLKWTLIIGLPILVIVATYFIIKMISGPSYDVDDIKKVKKACREVFDVEFEDLEIKKDEDYDRIYAPIGMVSHMRGIGIGTKEYYHIYVDWYEFSSEKEAREYYETQVNRAKESYESEKEQLEELYQEWYDGKHKGENSFETNDKLTEMCLERKDDVHKFVWIIKGNCILELSINGEDMQSLHDITKKFYKKLD